MSHLCSSHLFRKPIAVMAAAALWAASLSVPGLAQPSVNNAGTLTCTVADVPNKPSETVDLSCNFKTQAGASSDYIGSASTKSGAVPPAKLVFVWTVVAIASGKAPLLEGEFTIESGRQGPAVLIGGKDASTRLEPVTGKEQIAGPAEITSLTLKLAQTKA